MSKLDQQRTIKFSLDGVQRIDRAAAAAGVTFAEFVRTVAEAEAGRMAADWVALARSPSARPVRSDEDSRPAAQEPGHARVD